QDLEQDTDGSFRVARKVAADRVISVVDPDARHGHKSSARGFDGYKGHASVDPDSELITATTASAGNVGDAAAAPGLLAEVAAQVAVEPPPRPRGGGRSWSPGPRAPRRHRPQPRLPGTVRQRPRPPSTAIAPMAPGRC